MLTLAPWEHISRTLLNSSETLGKIKCMEETKRSRKIRIGKYLQLARFLEPPSVHGNRRQDSRSGSNVFLFKSLGQAPNVTLLLITSPKRLLSGLAAAFLFHLTGEKKCFRTSLSSAYSIKYTAFNPQRGNSW